MGDTENNLISGGVGFGIGYLLGGGLGAGAGGDANLVFRDDFSSYEEGQDAKPVWHGITGDWQVQNGEYVETIGQAIDPGFYGYMSVAPVPQYEVPHHFEWKMGYQNIPMEEWGIVSFGFFNMMEALPGYFLTKDNWDLKLRKDNPWDGPVINQWAIPSEAGEMHSYAVSYNPVDGLCRVWMDGEDLGVASISDPIQFAGYLTLWSMNVAVFDDIVVRRV